MGPVDTSGALVMGSHTYEWLLAHESLLDQPEKWLGLYGERPVFLFTRARRLAASYHLDS